MEAVFSTPDSHLFANATAFGAGLTVMGGSGTAFGAIANLGASQSQLPHWVLVQTEDEVVRLFASDRHGQTKGQLLLEAGRGTFRASLHRNIGSIQLMLFVPERPSIFLKGAWGPLKRKPMRVARSALDLAKP